MSGNGDIAREKRYDSVTQWQTGGEVIPTRCLIFVFLVGGGRRLLAGSHMHHIESFT